METNDLQKIVDNCWIARNAAVREYEAKPSKWTKNALDMAIARLKEAQRAIDRA